MYRIGWWQLLTYFVSLSSRSLNTLFADFAASYPSRRPFYVHDIWCISAWFVYFIGRNTQSVLWIQYMRIIALMLMDYNVSNDKIPISTISIIREHPI